MSKYPAIGDPQPTVESLHGTVQSLKIAVEMLSGQRPGDGAALTRYEQPTPPGNAALGDLWSDTKDAGKAYYWNGHFWVDISNSRFEDLAAQAAQAGLTDEQKQALTAEWWKQLLDEHHKISAEIDAAVEQSRVEFNNAVAEAEAAIALVQTDVDAARDEATAAIAEANAAIALAQADAQSALDELATITTTITQIQSDVSGNSAAITVEAGARATADTALAGQITTIQASVNANTASITSEQVTRASADTALSARIDNIIAIAGGATAAIDQEAIARAAADDALAAQITTLTSTVNGNTASISSEAVTRANADSALSAQITTVSASATKQRVFRQSSAPGATGLVTGDLWYDTSNSNKVYYWNGSNWIDSADARIAGLQTNVTTLQADVTTETVARANADSALSAQITTVSAVASKQRVFSQSTTPSSSGLLVGDLWIHTGDGNRIYFWNGSSWELKEDPRIPQLQASVTNEALARSNGDTALAAQISTVSASANRQRVFNQASAPSTTDRLVGDLWYASTDGFKPYYWNGSAWVDNSDNRFTTIAASVTNEAAARVSGDNAISAQITSLTSTVNGNTAAISNEATTRANADSSLSASLSSLQTTVNNNKAAFDNEVIARTNGDSALSGQITSLTTTVNNNKASLDNEIIARTNADSAISSNVSNLTTTVNGNTSSIQTLQASYNGMAVKYGVTGTINNQTGGFVLTGVGRNDGSASYLMEITSNVIINGNLLVTGSVKNQGLEDNAASNSALATGIKSSGDVSIRVRNKSRVACFASYSGNTNDAGGGLLKIVANGNQISSVPIVVASKNLPMTTITVYPGSAGSRVQGNGQADTNSVYSYNETYVAYTVFVQGVGFVPVNGTRTISFPAAYAFDDSASSIWLGYKSGNPWVRYSFTTGVVVGVYKVMGYSSSAGGSTQRRAPKAWSLQASNDGSNWTTLDTRSNQTGWGDQEDRQFTITSTGGAYASYSQYRMVITESVDASETIVGVVQLSFYLPGTAAAVEDVVFNAYVDTAASVAGYVSLYVVELSK